jgi:hypothetical protein
LIISPGLLEALIFVVVPPLISLSQLFVHLLVLSVGFVLLMLYIGAFESCTSREIVCESEVLFAVNEKNIKECYLVFTNYK